MVHTEAPGEHTFRVFLPGATTVALVGSFTGWRETPITMIRDRAGWWTVTLNIRPGDHEFSYLVDDATWIADYAASGVRPNGYGGYVSQLHVPAVTAAATITRLAAA